MRKPADQYADLLGKGSFHAEVMDKFQTSARIRKPREAEWLVQREFYRGNHYASYTKTYGLQQRPPADAPQRARLVYNYSRVNIEILVAYLLRNAPVFTVAANHGDSKSQSAAVLGRQLMRYYWLYLNCPEKLERTAFWVFNAGCCFWEVGWNPLAGTKHQIVKQRPVDQGMLSSLVDGVQEAIGMEVAAPQFEEYVENVPEGDPYIRIRSPFEVYPDFGAESTDDWQWALTATRRPVGEMKALFPNAKIEADSTWNYSQTYQRSALASFGASSQSLQPEKMNRALVLEYWQKPSPKHPDGLRVVATNEEVLQVSATPAGYDHIPLHMWSDRIVPGEFWPDGTMRDLVSPQKELNKRLSQLVDIADKYKPKWLAVKGSLSIQTLTSTNDELVEYQPGQRPEPINPPQFPDAPVKMVALSKESMETSSGATPTIQGQMQGDQRSGRQIAYMGDYAMGRISLLASHMSRFLSKSGTGLLKVLGANVVEKRVAKIVGPNRTAQVRQFIGADLMDCTDVTCETGSLLGFSRVERFDRVMQLIDKGALDKSQAFEALELEDFYNLYEPIVEDKNNAMLEEEVWRQGQPLEKPQNTAEGVYYYDDHVVHLRQHNSFRKSSDYKTLPIQMQAEVDKHCYIHECYVRNVNPETGLPVDDPGGSGGGQEAPGASARSGEPGATPGQDSPAQRRAANSESGQEAAEGLPDVKPVPPPSQQGPAGP